MKAKSRKTTIQAMLMVLACVGAVVVADVAQADQRPYAALQVDPNTLRLEQYTGGSLTVIWWNWGQGGTFPSSSCMHLDLPSAASQSERSRFFGLVLGAKAAGKPLTIHYYPDDCTLMSFAADAW